jgi:hypothetical protein
VGKLTAQAMLARVAINRQDYEVLKAVAESMVNPVNALRSSAVSSHRFPLAFQPVD